MKQRGNRDTIFLATKVGARLKDPKRIRDERGTILSQLVPEEYEHLAPTAIRRGIEGSLRRLQTYSFLEKACCYSWQPCFPWRQ